MHQETEHDHIIRELESLRFLCKDNYNHYMSTPTYDPQRHIGYLQAWGQAETALQIARQNELLSQLLTQKGLLQHDPIVAVARDGKFYCPPCMKNKRVDGNDEQVTQEEVDAWKLHPGWQVLCSGCDKVLSSPDGVEEEERED